MGITVSQQKLIDSEKKFINSFNLKDSIFSNISDITERQRYEIIAQEIFDQQNIVRQNPQSMIPYLEHKLERFDNKLLYKSKTKLTGGQRTEEGIDAVKEAIEWLKKKSSEEKLEFSWTMKQVSSDRLGEVDERSDVIRYFDETEKSHEIVQQYCKQPGRVSESLSFGEKTAMEVVSSLIVDDGNADRSNRKSVFSPEFSGCGIQCIKHPKSAQICALNYMTDHKTCDLPKQKQPEIIEE